jgi:urease accessory protein
MRTGKNTAAGAAVFPFLMATWATFMNNQEIMLRLDSKTESTDRIDGELVLPYDMREKSRLRAKLTSGEEVTVFTARGTVLRHGDCLRGSDGRVVKISAAMEATYRVSCKTPLALLRCAFHLGNRHAQTQLGTTGHAGYLRIREDSVLKDMLEGLGATVTREDAAFEPEAGAYGGHRHADHPLAPVPLRQRIHRPSDPEQS